VPTVTARGLDVDENIKSKIFLDRRVTFNLLMFLNNRVLATKGLVGIEFVDDGAA
jgi:hypothetical protein